MCQYIIQINILNTNCLGWHSHTHEHADVNFAAMNLTTYLIFKCTAVLQHCCGIISSFAGNSNINDATLLWHIFVKSKLNVHFHLNDPNVLNKQNTPTICNLHTHTSKQWFNFNKENTLERKRRIRISMYYKIQLSNNLVFKNKQPYQ